MDPFTSIIPGSRRQDEESKNRKSARLRELMVFAEVFRFLCKTVNLMKFIFFAASVFYKGSFNLFSLSPAGDPCSFLFLFFLPLPFCVWPFLAFSTSVSVFSPPPPFSPPLSFSLSHSLFSPHGSVCFNNDALGSWDSGAAFSPLHRKTQASFSSSSSYFSSLLLWSLLPLICLGNLKQWIAKRMSAVLHVCHCRL